MANHRLARPWSEAFPTDDTLRRAVEHVMETGNDFVIDVDRRTLAVVISPEAYADLQRARDRERRRRLLAALDREALESDGEPRDLTDEELEDVAIELGKEINQRVAQRLDGEAWRNKRSDAD